MLAVVYGIVFGGAFAASKKIFEDVPPDADSRTSWDWGLRILAVLIWGVCSLLYDFARAARRYSPLIGAWRAFRFARRALSGSWTKGLALFLFWFLIGGAAWLACIAAAWYLPAVSVPAIALLFFLQILGLGARSAVRIATWGSYLAFLDSRARAAIVATTRIKYTIAVGDRDPVPVA
ncbi:MAG: hypothetical protein NEA02_01185, partial [Thermoanaerobaculia bacterium]|nr:hypothetical protein [Thermoanaerobaculia bacterium]